jgi:alpha-1,3/alpha-1,6-mannosyltransferase
MMKINDKNIVLEKNRKLNILILHLDLGIGGAEQLMITIARSLQEIDHNIEILTTHHDKNHCFDETKPDGKQILHFSSLHLSV